MAINSKSTKNEILKAYEEANKAKLALEKELMQVKKNLTKLETQGSQQSPNTIIEEKIITKIVEKAANVNDVEGILATLESIEAGVNPALSTLSDKLTAEAEQLSALLQNIEKEENALLNLYELKVAEDTVEELLEKYKNTQEEFQTEKRQKETTFEQEIQAKRKAWLKEQNEKQRAIQERNLQDQQQKQRDFDNYQYDLELQRDLQLDEYQQKQKALQDLLLEAKEQKQEQWAEAEKIVAEKEKEFETYKKKFEEIPEKLEKEIKKAEAEGKAIIEKEAKIKADLLEKEIDGQKKLHDLKVKALDAQLKTQELQLASLSKQLENAFKQAQDLAIKSIEGLSRSETFDAVREIALEQAKNQPKSK